MLVKNLLGMHKSDDYFFALYWCGDVGIESLIVKKNKGYYDVRNHEPIQPFQIGYKENLLNYAKTDKKYLTNRTAKKLAKPYYDEFNQNCTKYCKENGFLNNSGKGFEI